MAMADLEAGRLKDAEEMFKTIVMDAGETPHRALSIVYLCQISDEATELVKETLAEPVGGIRVRRRAIR